MHKDCHGPAFMSEAERIKELAKVDVGVYHNYITQNEYYQEHILACDGTCTLQPHKFSHFYRYLLYVCVCV